MGCAYFTIMAGSKSEIGKDPVNSFWVDEHSAKFQNVEFGFLHKSFCFYCKVVNYNESFQPW